MKRRQRSEATWSSRVKMLGISMMTGFVLMLTGCGEFFPFFPKDSAPYALEYNALDVNKDVLAITFPVAFAKQDIEYAPDCSDQQEVNEEVLIYSFTLLSHPSKSNICGPVSCAIDDPWACTIKCITDCDKGFLPKTESFGAFLRLTWNVTEQKKAELREKFGDQNVLSADMVLDSPVFNLKKAKNVTPPDADHDGVADADDNCVNTANADQQDANNDGVGDACGVDNDGDVETDATSPISPTLLDPALAGSDGGCTVMAGMGSAANPIALILLGLALLPLASRRKEPPEIQ